MQVCEPSLEELYFDWDGRMGRFIGNFQDRLAFDLFGRDRSTETDVRQPIRADLADRVEEAGWKRGTGSKYTYIRSNK
jgi:hypothetical protein